VLAACAPACRTKETVRLIEEAGAQQRVAAEGMRQCRQYRWLSMVVCTSIDLAE